MCPQTVLYSLQSIVFTIQKLSVFRYNVVMCWQWNINYPYTEKLHTFSLRQIIKIVVILVHVEQQLYGFHYLVKQQC